MKTGKVVALEVDYYSNAGNTVDLSRGVSRTHPLHASVTERFTWAGTSLHSYLLL